MASARDWHEKARPSLAYMADKFNTAPPPGYVAGRGRGAAGFAKPLEAPKPRGAPLQDGRHDENEEPDTLGSSSLEGSGAVGSDGKLEGEAADTNELDLSETEKFEVQTLSMEQADSGSVMEPFNMNSERREGHFDDDFNFVWKRKGDDPDDVHDAWLGEVDEGRETDEKVEKRRKLLQRQIDVQNAEDEPEPDKMALWQQLVGVLRDGESVAGALRRLSVKRPQQQKRKQQPPSRQIDERSSEEQLLCKQQFDLLTEAADKLLGGGQFDVYSERKEGVLKRMDESAAAPPAATSSSANASLGADAAAVTKSHRIAPEVHEAALAGGFALDAESGIYYSSSNGLCFDPKTSLYWRALVDDCYYYWDSAANQFVPYTTGEDVGEVVTGQESAEPATTRADAPTVENGSDEDM